VQRLFALRYSNAIAISCTMSVITMLVLRGLAGGGGLETLVHLDRLESQSNGLWTALPIVMFQSW